MQVLHGERSLHNARGGWDLARFLADPDKDDVEAHLANLRCELGFGRVQEGHCRGRTLRRGFCVRLPIAIKNDDDSSPAPKAEQAAAAKCKHGGPEHLPLWFLHLHEHEEACGLHAVLA